MLMALWAFLHENPSLKPEASACFSRKLGLLSVHTCMRVILSFQLPTHRDHYWGQGPHSQTRKFSEIKRINEVPF